MFGPSVHRGSSRFVLERPDSLDTLRQFGIPRQQRKFSLDSRFPVAAELRSLMIRLAESRNLRTPRSASTRLKLPLTGSYEPDVDGIDRLFYTPERTQLVLSIAALGGASPYPLSIVTGLSVNGIRYATSDLEHVGILASRREGK